MLLTFTIYTRIVIYAVLLNVKSSLHPWSVFCIDSALPSARFFETSPLDYSRKNTDCVNVRVLDACSACFCLCVWSAHARFSLRPAVLGARTRYGNTEMCCQLCFCSTYEYIRCYKFSEAHTVKLMTFAI